MQVRLTPVPSHNARSTSFWPGRKCRFKIASRKTCVVFSRRPVGSSATLMGLFCIELRCGRHEHSDEDAACTAASGKIVGDRTYVNAPPPPCMPANMYAHWVLFRQ